MSAKNLSAPSITLVWIRLDISVSPLRMTAFSSSLLPNSSGSRNCFATLCSASVGQRSYQSIVQQLISDGNMRQRTRKAEPTGDIASTICRFSRTVETKSCFRLSFVSGTPRSFASGRTAEVIFSHSSLAKRLGTSPELRMLLISSINDSCALAAMRVRYLNKVRVLCVGEQSRIPRPLAYRRIGRRSGNRFCHPRFFRCLL